MSIIIIIIPSMAPITRGKLFIAKKPLIISSSSASVRGILMQVARRRANILLT
jgi:hypothetical protein